MLRYDDLKAHRFPDRAMLTHLDKAEQRIAAAMESGATHLDLSHLAIERLPDAVGSLTRLLHLDLSLCSSLTDLSSLSRLDGLQSLDLSWCSSLTKLNPLETLTSLQHLNLSACGSLIDLKPLATLTGLQDLKLGMCRSLTSLSPLTSLMGLQSLDVSQCTSLFDLSPLEALKNLTKLILIASDSIELSTIKKITSLQYLDLRLWHSLTDLRPLTTLTALQHLELDQCRSLTDLSPLEALTKLQILDLNGCDSLSDLRPLRTLASLQDLDLSLCGGVTDLSPLSAISGLKRLGLSQWSSLSDLNPLNALVGLVHLDLSGCGAVTDLNPLTALTGLQHLNLRLAISLSDLGPLKALADLRYLDLCLCSSVSNLEPMKALIGLQYLDLSECHSVTDLSPLSALNELQHLKLSWCVSIHDLAPLSELSGLLQLELQECSRLRRFGPIRGLIGQLHGLRLSGCQFDDLPVEVCGKRNENVIDKVRAHYADLEDEAAPGADLKLFVLGNGGVGKTQLCRRLRGLGFDQSVPSTHGIELGELDVMPEAQAGETKGTTPVRLHLWDFGGQDIYHGTHTLFLQGRAVFLVLWTPTLECGTVDQGGETVELRPLAYWLDYVRNLTGEEATVLVVHSQCDEPEQRSDPPLAPNGFRYARCLDVSARTGLGLAALRGELNEAVREELAYRPLPAIGAGRVRLRQRLRERRAEDQARPANERHWRTMNRGQFDELCEQTGGISNTGAVLDYLHQCGELFHRPDLFGGAIVLDQSWALDAIYTVFDRQRVRPYLRNDGRFTLAHLRRLAWSDYSEHEQKLFLSYMRSCGVCFPVRKPADSRHDEATWDYLAPELLPTKDEVQGWLAGRMQGEHPVHARLHYRFLHEGVLRTLLARIGERSMDNAVYWKYGFWFYSAEHDAQILMQSTLNAQNGSGEIALQAQGHHAEGLIQALLDVIAEIRVGEAPQIEQNGANAVPIDARPHRSRDRPRPDAPDDTVPDHAPVASPSPDLPGNKDIWVSYAWGDDQSEAGRQRKLVVEGVCDALRQRGWTVHRDCEEMRKGDWISDYMKAIGRADRVLVILSKKYLQSVYCMTELHNVYVHCKKDARRFLSRIVPLTLDDAAYISASKRRLACARLWKRRLESSRRDIGKDLDLLSVRSFVELKLMGQLPLSVDDMLSSIADQLHPVGFDNIVRDDYAGLFELLERADRENI